VRSESFDENGEGSDAKEVGKDEILVVSNQKQLETSCSSGLQAGGSATDEETGGNMSLMEAGKDPCPVCFEDYTNGDEIAWSKNGNCSHVYHVNCILTWLMKHDDCPICRSKYFQTVDAAQ